ncbi:ABC transporter substrate-binding protein [Aquabacterium humicola]|uniref:ABC transporter substrate-binding protein n=1 Tax=Aquabacterium humicola TaxID=3237377 RepID=UPI002543B0E3|nr:ABC transporter substrate-binding protein [Rubrivivax pictus]
MASTRRQFSLAAAAAFAARGAAAAPTPSDWPVLQVVPLSGVNGGIGWHLRVGALVAFAEANAAGAAFGRTLRLMTLDEEPGQVAAQVRGALRDSEALALLALHGRGTVGELARSGLPARAGLPVLGVMSGSASAPGFDAPWLFNIRGTFAHEIDQVLAHAATVHARRIVLVTGHDDDGHEVAALAAARAGSAGLQLMTVPPHPADSAEVAEAVTATLRLPHDVVVLATNTAAVAYFAKLYAAGGGRARLIALSSAEATQLAAVVGASAARGLLISQLVPHPRDPKIRLMREFSAAYKRHGPPELAPTLAMTEAYIAARVLIAQLQRTGPQATGAALQRTLAAAPPSFELAGLPLSLKRRGATFRSLSAIGRDGQLLF